MGDVWGRRRSAVAAATALVVSVATVAVAASLGVAAGGTSTDPRIPRTPSLAYEGLRPDGLVPLDAAFVRATLGIAAAPMATARIVAGAAARAITPHSITRHELTNDTAAAAWSIASVPFTAETNTRAASRDDDPTACAAVGPTVWYAYRSERKVALVASTLGSDHSTALGVFDGAARNEALVGCDTDTEGSSLVTFTADAGHTYLFQVTAPAGGGQLVFNVDHQGRFLRASVGASGEPPNEFSGRGSISGDGRFVAFTSSARNLVAGDGPEDEPCATRNPTSEGTKWVTACPGAWLRDLERGTTELLSVSNEGEPADADVYWPFISNDGRYVVFWSTATNLTSDDTSGNDLFLRDRGTGRTERIPARDPLDPAVDGGFQATLSDDGRYIAFQTPSALDARDTNGVTDVYVYDRRTARIELVTVTATGDAAAELTDQRTPQPAANAVDDHDVPDLSPFMSGNGRYVVFRSNASDLVPGDTNGTYDTFIRDRVTQTTERVSVATDGGEGDGASMYNYFPAPSVSSDGRFVVFASAASNLVADDRNGIIDVFVRDRVNGTTTRVTVAWDAESRRDEWLFAPSISRDGRYVLWESGPTVAGMTVLAAETSGIYRYDTLTETLALVTLPPTGAEGYGSFARISADGQHVVFESASSEFAGETNGFWNAFVYEFFSRR